MLPVLRSPYLAIVRYTENEGKEWLSRYNDSFAMEEIMNTVRMLLPFTHGVDLCAIEHAIRLAKSRNATLVPLAVVSVPKGRRTGGARLEHIQQSKDFLEAVQQKAARYQVPVERYEVFTSNIRQSIATLTWELHCDSILVFVTGQKGVLLDAREIKQLLEGETAQIFMVRLEPNNRGSVRHLLGKTLSLWSRGKRKDEVYHGQEYPESVAKTPVKIGTID